MLVIDDIYKQNGFDSRLEYLIDLAEQYYIPVEIVISIANLLGPEEDFDGLISMIQDYSEVL